MLNEKPTNEFQEVIKNYLEEFAKSDAHFAERYALEEKTLSECEKYIMGEVRSKTTGPNAVMSDDEVYQMARHYYLEDNIKVNPVQATATPATKKESIKLSSKDKEQLKVEAEKEYKRQCIEELKAKEQKKKQAQIVKQKKHDEDCGQISLFDFGG